MRKLFVTAAVLGTVMMYAGGFRVSLQGVRQLAMAHTSAHAEDASVAFFNPAGISFIPAKLSVAAGGFGAKTKITYQNPSTLESYATDNPMGTPIYAAVTYKVMDKVSVGFSLSTPFGSTIEWPADWSGREIVQRLELKSFYLQPMVSVKVADWASIGASYIHARGSVDWDRAVTQFGGTMNISKKGASGNGFGLGVYLRPTDKLDVSAAYRSAVDMEAKDGTSSFYFPNMSPEAQQIVYNLIGLDGNGQDKFDATLPLVAEYTLGVSYKVTPKWKLAADLNVVDWGKYDKLTLDFANAPVGNQPGDPTILVAPKNFHATYNFRVGTEYLITDMIAGRLGWYYDESPYEDKDFIPETPSFDAHVITAGLGFNFGGFGADLAVAKTFPKARNVENAYSNFYGQAKAESLYFGLGLRYNLIK